MTWFSTNSKTLLLIGLAVLHCLWRLIVFIWNPLNLTGSPYAAYEASTFASSGLLAMWLVLGSEPLHWRVTRLGGAYLILRVAQDAGLLIHDPKVSDHHAIQLFRWVDDYTILVSFGFALAIRWLTGWRLQHIAKGTPAISVNQFRLKQLLAATALIGALLAAAKSDWLKEKMPHSGIDAILALHAILISMSLPPALILLWPRLSWQSLLLAILAWISVPFLFSGYFRLAEVIVTDDMFDPYVLVLAASPSTVALFSAIALRLAGYRLFVPLAIPSRRRRLPVTIEVPILPTASTAE
ncbi:hypothetical protein NA78x_004933 [Anatilimnocola sp. NA78]|uniref:hypothetical protein n=1 Tax=Anatilimnocola sp. NA78 TaxID=3415683 RepID=UPI003CE4C32F